MRADTQPLRQQADDPSDFDAVTMARRLRGKLPAPRGVPNWQGDKTVLAFRFDDYPDT
jgi:hypothetical protein